jgi:hypothetical protein
MDITQLPLADGKSDYNFEEAASVLGMSSLELRTLVIERLTSEDAPLQNLSRHPLLGGRPPAHAGGSEGLRLVSVKIWNRFASASVHLSIWR